MKLYASITEKRKREKENEKENWDLEIEWMKTRNLGERWWKEREEKKQEVALGIYMFEGYKETCLSSSFDSRSIFTMILA